MKNLVETIVVSATQMRDIESQIFAAGMPVAALMEKAARLCASRIQGLYPVDQYTSVGLLVGPGHNGGDALVVARELFLAGYQVKIYRPLFKLKQLTAQHANYAASLGIIFHEEIEPLKNCQLLVDGLFGFSLTRELPQDICEAIAQVNSWQLPIVSIDLPSGIDTDTGQVWGNAIHATHTFCLGLWKRAFFQDQALAYFGQSIRLDLGLLRHHIWSVLPQPAPLRKMTQESAREFLPLPRATLTHKYQQGHLLLICGSRRYAGAAILTALGAKASGVGMLSVAVPESLKMLLVSQIPDALIVECPENKEGAIASLPLSVSDLNQYAAVACGPGLTKEATTAINKVLQLSIPLILDADGLNIVAENDLLEVLIERTAPTILTPHQGEFKRLFPEIISSDRIFMVQQAAVQSNAIIVLKGARTAIANPQGLTWLVPQSTPALARGGSGDVLTGLTAGLVAQPTSNASTNLIDIVATAAWWHAQAGLKAVQEHTELGVDALTLTHYLSTAVNELGIV